MTFFVEICNLTSEVLKYEYASEYELFSSS